MAAAFAQDSTPLVVLLAKMLTATNEDLGSDLRSRSVFRVRISRRNCWPKAAG